MLTDQVAGRGRFIIEHQRTVIEVGCGVGGVIHDYLSTLSELRKPLISSAWAVMVFVGPVHLTKYRSVPPGISKIAPNMR